MPDKINSLPAQRLMNKILTQAGNSYFISFTNADGKRWIVPQRQMAVGLNIYQPISFNGKLLKRYLPYLKNSDWILRRLRMKKKAYRLCDELVQLLSGLFGTEHLEFSVFGGTPSAHQKITIQLSSGKTILGYCKVTDHEEIKSLFRHEQQILDELKNKGVGQIPECLYCGELTENMAVFVQTTKKTNTSKTPYHWNYRHWEFLSHLHEQTRQKLPFEQTDFCRSMEELSNNLNYLTPPDAAIISRGIEKVRQQFDGKEVVFSACHNDFTPWNMFVEQEELFVFDFEYAQRTYPPYLDWFHFFTQSGIFKKHWDAENMFKAYQKQKQSFSDYFPDPDFAYQCYFLSIIALYLHREKGHSAPVMAMIKTWITLLSFLSNESEK